MKTAALPIAPFPIAGKRGNAIIMNAGPQNPGPQNAERMFNEITELLGTRFRDHEEQIGNIAAALETMQGNTNLLNMPQGVIATGPVDAAYTASFASYFRRGDQEAELRTANASGERAMVQNALSAGSSTDGGYLAPVEWDRKLQQRQRSNSPMRRLATVQSTSVGAYTTVWNADTWGSGWVGETAARPLTTASTLAQITFPTGEIYAQPAATQRLLDDAAINLDNWLVDGLEREFNRQENIAFISGDGVNKPAGLLTYVAGGVNATLHPGGPIEVVTAAIDIDTLTNFLYGLDAAYRQNATWLLSSPTAAFIAKIKDADGRPIWRESLIVGQPATLLGRPVEIDEAMPAPTAGNLAIAFGDFAAGYVVNDRMGTRILRDPYTNKGFVNFYTTKRVGGGLLNPFAIRLMRITI